MEMCKGGCILLDGSTGYQSLASRVMEGLLLQQAHVIYSRGVSQRELKQSFGEKIWENLTCHENSRRSNMYASQCHPIIEIAAFQ
jgi:hypothetical protein